MKFLSLFLMSLFISFKSFCAEEGLVAAVMQSNLIGQFSELCDRKIAEVQGKIDVASGTFSEAPDPRPSDPDDAAIWDLRQQQRPQGTLKQTQKNQQDLQKWLEFKSGLSEVFTVAFIQELNRLPNSVTKSKRVQAIVKTAFKFDIGFVDANKIMANSPVQILEVKKEIESMGPEEFAKTRGLFVNGDTGQWVSRRDTAVGVGMDEFGRRRGVFIGSGLSPRSDDDSPAPRRPVFVDPELSSAMTASGFGGRPPAGYEDDPDTELAKAISLRQPGPSADPYGVTVSSPPAPFYGGYGGMGSRGYGGAGESKDGPSGLGYGVPAMAPPPPPLALTNGGLTEEAALALAMKASTLDARQRADSDEMPFPTGPVYQGSLTDPEFQGVSINIRTAGAMVDDPAEAANYFDQQVIENGLQTNPNRKIFIDSVNRLLTEEGFNQTSFDGVLRDFLSKYYVGK